MKYIAPGVLLLLSNEIISLLALIIALLMFMSDIVVERGRYRG